MEVPFESCIRGYHVYKNIWNPTVNEVLSCARDTTNEHDPFAVMVTKTVAPPAGTSVVGHLPKKISSTCSMFLRKGGSISCRVTGNQQYSSDLVQGGLEIPCILSFESNDGNLIAKVKKMLLVVRKLSKM